MLNMQTELVGAAELMHELFVDNFGRNLRVQIGGGSTLAARYNHRLSTDLDLWRKEPETEADRIFDATPSMELEDLLAHDAWMKGKPSVDMYGNIRGMLKPEAVGAELPPEVDGIEVSAGRELTFPKSKLLRQQGNVITTILRPQNDEEILWGKLIRMKDRELTQRDLYDFAVMSHLAPERIEYALDEVGARKRYEIGKAVEKKVIDRTKPLLRTTWDVPDLEAVKKGLLVTLGSKLGLGQDGQPKRMGRHWDLSALQATCVGHKNRGQKVRPYTGMEF